ncbi:MAG: YciI family protein [Xanthomonadales bacterium]|nr:YciI family protein [Xanthomonadales bacterium]
MKRFVLMHFGFEQPTPEIMQAWGQWFEQTADCTEQNLGFMGGKEISADGVRDLPWDLESITGCSIIQAEDMAEAERIASANPYVSAVRVYEIREHG